MQIHFRCTENQSRWVWTDGLRILGQREIAVQVSWPEQDVRDTLLTQLLEFLESYITGKQKYILPGQTLPYGWTVLRFVSDEQQVSGIESDVLLIQEKQYISSRKNQYTSGVSCTMALLQLQHEAMQRNRVTGEAAYPSSSQLVIVCTRAMPEKIQYLRPLMVHRAWQPTMHRSGWFIGCCEHEHDHDNPHELASVHLSHIIERFPGLFPYVAMPVGTQLLFEDNQAIIFHPGEQYGQVDPEHILSSLPCEG